MMRLVCVALLLAAPRASEAAEEAHTQRHDRYVGALLGSCSPPAEGDLVSWRRGEVARAAEPRTLAY